MSWACSTPGRRRLKGWGPALVSFALAVAYGLYIALRTYEVDLGVYLRLGGKYVFTSHLYSFVLPNTSLPFTYPPFAALLFAPWQRTFSNVGSVQTVWTMGNVAALVGVLVLSVRLVKPSLDQVATWRLALALSLPALLLNPVLITIGFGQVNLFVTLPGHVGSAQRTHDREATAPARRGHRARRGGQAHTAAVRPVSRADPAVARGRDGRADVRGVRAGDVRGLAHVLEGLLDQGHLQAGACRRSHDRGQPEPLGCPRPLHARRAARWPHAPVAPRDRRRRAPAGGAGAPAVITAPGRARLRRDVPPRLPHLVGPSPGVGRAGDPVAGLRARPAALGRPLAGATAVLFWSAPVWWVPYKNTSDLHLNPLQLVAGNSFFFAMLLFLAGAAVLVVRRRGGRAGSERSLPRSAVVGHLSFGEVAIPRRWQEVRMGTERPPFLPAFPRPVPRWGITLGSCPSVVTGRSQLPYRPSFPIATLVGEGGVIVGASGGIRHPALFSFP